MYKIKLTVNGKIVDLETEDIKKTLMKIRPEQVLTDMFVEIIKGESGLVRKLDLRHAKRVFGDEQQLDIFLNNLLF